MDNHYEPDQTTLRRYANVLVNFALNSGSGIKQGEVVQCLVPDVAKPLYGELQRAILKAGGQPIMRFLATGYDRQFYELANKEQLTFFPESYLKSRAELIDHSIAIIAEHDLHELHGLDPVKIIEAQESKKKMREWLSDKEYAGKFTWTLALYGTPAMAKEAQLSLNEYWQQIINACFLDDEDPIGRWKEVSKTIDDIRNTLNVMEIDRLHVEAEGVDLWITLGEERKWMGGSGRNIPSFEIFTSPDWRGTEGVIAFNQPLYRYGNLISGIELEFKEGRVVRAKAKQNEDLLKQMLARPDADKVGEFSLTDSRLSRISKFMANTLYDENIGAEHGNTHIAIGMAYKDAYRGDVSTVTKEELDRLGFNNIYAGEHCDMMSTSERRVTARLKDGSERVIYEAGRFVI
jgi:aminopeptidase